MDRRGSVVCGGASVFGASSGRRVCDGNRERGGAGCGLWERSRKRARCRDEYECNDSSFQCAAGVRQPSTSYCCAASCGVCGGDTCNKQPGGRPLCCPLCILKRGGTAAAGRRSTWGAAARRWDGMRWGKRKTLFQKERSPNLENKLGLLARRPSRAECYPKKGNSSVISKKRN